MTKRKKTDQDYGFTFMELMVAMLLLVIIIGTAVPYVNSTLGVEVKSSARKLVGTLRFVFDESVLRSSNYRVAFNLDRHSYSVEKCPGVSSFLYQNEQARREGEAKAEERQRQSDASARSTGEQLPVPLADSTLNSCQPIVDEDLQPIVLKEPVSIIGVWTPQYSEIIRGNPSGPSEDSSDDTLVYVNFLKGGYAERAYIYLSDGGEDKYTLELEPLTGNVILHDGEYEVPREFWRQ